MSTTAAKTRRFLAVPAGSYPEPRRARRVAGAAPSPSPALLAEEAAALPPEDPALPAAGAVAPAPPAGIAVPAASPALPDIPPSAVVRPPESRSPADFAPQHLAETPRAGAAWGRILVGGVAGTLFGLVAGGMLMALSGGPDGLEALSQPVKLWQSIDDPLVKASALLVAVGFVLLGAGLAGRRRN